MGPQEQPAVNLDRYLILDGLFEGCQVIGFDWRYLYVNRAAERHARKTRDELLGAAMTSVYPDIEQTALFAMLRRCMETRATGHLETEFPFPGGADAWFELRAEPVPEGTFVLSLDITARRRAERAIEQQLERVRSLRAIDVAILSTTDFRFALKTVLDEATKRLGVDAAIAFLLNPGMTSLESAASIGFRSPAVNRTTIRVGEGAVGQAALRRRTVLVPNLLASDVTRLQVRPVLLDEGMRGVAAVPLIAKGQLIGVFEMACRQPLTVSDDWIGFLEALAGQAAMAIDAGKSFEDLQSAHLELALAYETTIEGWSRALDLRDQDTANHTLRVANMTVELARSAGVADADIVHLRRGALLHDIGKMAIPDAILHKREKLTDEEVAVMRQHPVHAHSLLSPIAYLRPALDIPYCHHERWDGTGYPRGLAGEAIPVAARLFAVVDVWDALRSRRPYHEEWSVEQASAELRKLAGTHLDPTVVDLFLRKVDNWE